jgi:hypothetical protein
MWEGGEYREMVKDMNMVQCYTLMYRNGERPLEIILRGRMMEGVN